MVGNFFKKLLLPKGVIKKISGLNHWIPIGKRVSVNLTNPYIPSFSDIPASTTEPGVDASVWASGNHIAKGNAGSFIPEPAANRKAKSFCWSTEKWKLSRRVKSVDPAICSRNSMPVSNKEEPRIVKISR